MRKNTKKKLAPVVVAVIVTAVTLPLVLVFLGAMGFISFTGSDGEWAILPILAVYALVLGAVVVGVLAATRERLREIDRGEEEEAKKY